MRRRRRNPALGGVVGAAIGVLPGMVLGSWTAGLASVGETSVDGIATKQRVGLFAGGMVGAVAGWMIGS